MVLKIDSKLCCGCEACGNACPQDAISFSADKEGFFRPTIDPKRCVQCDLCNHVCPTLNVAEKNNDDTCYAAYSLRLEDQNNSSSGGLFTLLAEAIINRGGIAYGATLDDEMRVTHQGAETIADMKKLKGSKYVQSRIANGYRDVEIQLKLGRPVYFSGTPCQVYGLNAYLGKEYDNLICQDIICHGVPSPKVLEHYLKETRTGHRNEIRSVSFRDKKYGWKSFSMRISYADGVEHVKDRYNDPYLMLFLSNMDLRDSCYHCSFKGDHRNSDITLADFWGIEKVDPEMYSDMGVSLVICHNEKGRGILYEIFGSCKWKEENLQESLAANKAWGESVKRPQGRDRFFTALETDSLKKLKRIFCKTPLRKKLKNMLNSIKRRHTQK